jgi:quercetin dioxygenase-like cupin family protein
MPPLGKRNEPVGAFRNYGSIKVQDTLFRGSDGNRTYGSQPSSKGPTETFIGSVRRDPILTADAPSRLATGYVTFESGARTYWHGAGSETAMTHIAVTEAVDGSAVDWMEPVNDGKFEGK